MTSNLSLFPGMSRGLSITPRYYQVEAEDETFRLFMQGEVGVLHRVATGLGKTIGACMCFERWLNHDENNRCMVISYEKQLVWQFAQEIEDVMGLKPGIEMERENIHPDDVPRVVVASRQTLLRAKPQSKEQALDLADLCLDNTEAVPHRVAKMLITNLRDGWTTSWAQEVVDELNEDYRASRELGSFSRLYKFDPKFNWLLCFDEAHKHAHILRSVGHLVDWFRRNPASKQIGLTATPKRSDNISLKSKMFPGVAIDFPLTRAVDEGYAVAYDQRFVHVDELYFEDIEVVAGDFTESSLDLALNNEKQLARCVEPMLDMVEDRSTLIFSPTIDMANNVAQYINARCRCKCPCGQQTWVPELSIERGKKCPKCGEILPLESVNKSGDQARSIWGTTPPAKRKVVYEDHQSGKFQFLSVCGLCKEGYNAPNVACIAVFRPVTKKASSLAEQMKGRGCRPLRGIIDGLETAEERLEAIKNSPKPDCLVVDLVGVSGLADSATTAAIYGEGLPDEVIERADSKLLRGEGDVRKALEKATEEVEAEREAAEREKQRERQQAEEAARRRSRANVRVKYTVRQSGHAVGRIGTKIEASQKQLNYIKIPLGLDLNGHLITKAQASRIIAQLKSGMPVSEVKYKNHLPKQCHETQATAKQKKYLRWKSIPHDAGLSFKEASEMIDKDKQPEKAASVQVAMDLMNLATTNEALTDTWQAIRDQGLSKNDLDIIIQHGKLRREAIKNLNF